MQLTTAYFSPTGTTAAVSRAIARGFYMESREVDLSASVSEAALGSDAVLLAAAPVYGGRVPAVAVERLSALKGDGAMAVAVVVYGNRDYDDALLEWKNALEQNGFRVVAAAAFIAEHSIVRSIAAGRPDENDLRTAERFGASVAEKIVKPLSEQASVQVPGKAAYKDYKGLPFHPKADKHCTKCGACAKACPVGAIPPEAPALTSESKCITCMRCVAVCPMKARGLPAPALLGAKAMLMASAKELKQPAIFL